jgi:hypothetical protein
MEQISGYVIVLSKTMIEQQLNKPFFGKPYLKFGQCFIMMMSFFQMGGILGAKYSNKYDSFARAFLGVKGENDAIINSFNKIKDMIVNDFDLNSMSIFSYNLHAFKQKIGYLGNDENFLHEYFMKKVPQTIAMELIQLSALSGASIGVTHPTLIKNLYENTHVKEPQDRYKLAVSIGLNIPEKQEIVPYEEEEKIDSTEFMEYCKSCCPSHYNVLLG